LNPPGGSGSLITKLTITIIKENNEKIIAGI
jgi:hypothetical protein